MPEENTRSLRKMKGRKLKENINIWRIRSALHYFGGLS